MDALAGGGAIPQKAHRPSRVKKKKTKVASGNPGTGGKKHAVAKPGALARRLRLAADRSEKRAQNPVAPIDRTSAAAIAQAPRVVTVVGPSGVGKSTLIRNLVKHYSKRNLPQVAGPVTLVSGRKKRITFLEVGSDLSCLLDAAKVADIVLLVIDAAFGFEMETFEFLNIAAAHGMPKVIAVLTHLDKLRDGGQVRKAKKALKARIWAELYDGAKVFYFSGITTTGDYLSREVLNLARFISVAKTPTLRWRVDHPFVLADRVEDVSPANLPATANRTIAAYGYVRGAPVRPAAGEWHIHLAGVGDLSASNIRPLPDPCPPPEVSPTGAAEAKQDDEAVSKGKRKISERQRVLYAPMAPEVDGIAYDNDAVYITLNRDNIRFSEKDTLVQEGVPEDGADGGSESDDSSDGEGEQMVKSLQKGAAPTVDESMKRAKLQIVKGGKSLVSDDFVDGRQRRRAVFNDDGDGVSDSEDGDDDSEDSSDGEDEDVVDAQAIRRDVPSRRTSSEPEQADGDEDENEESSDDELSEVNEENGNATKSDIHSEDEADDKEADDVEETFLAEDIPNEQASPTSEGNNVSHVDGSSDESEDERTGCEEKYESESDDEEEAHNRASKRWKENMLNNAERNLLSTRSASKALIKFIYEKNERGEYKSAVGGVNSRQAESFEDEEKDEGEDDTFFTRRRSRTPTTNKENALVDIPDILSEDVTRLIPNRIRAWTTDENLCQQLRKKRWGTGQNRNDDDAGSDIDGDFEDLETGEVHKANGSNGNSDKDEGVIDGDASDGGSDLEAIRAEKIRQKERFNAEWDRNGGRAGVREGREDSEGNDGTNKDNGPDVRSRKALRGEADREPDFRKLERERAEKVKEEELANMDAEARRAVEGVLPGQYVRVELNDVPVEFVRCFDPARPILLGGLRTGDDEGETMLRGRVRRHRFKRGVLKSNDPCVFSIGWRRFQSMPVYDMEDTGKRRRFVKYTPEYLHCNANFYAPCVAPGAGIVMCQTLGRERGGFRVAATGVVTEVNVDSEIMKKLKLVGEAVKVHRNTAFIRGMFNSELEASKYIGAAIRTVSGIRGVVKKAVSENAQRGGIDREVARAPAGTFRAGFEDRILLSDVVFLRAWVPVPVERYCSVASTMLEVAGGVGKGNEGEGKEIGWRMRTVREIREEEGMAIPLKKDSLYRDVERKKAVFAPLKVPKAVEGALPFASKPKMLAPVPGKRMRSGGGGGATRKVDVRKERAVVVDGQERKERQLLQAVYNIRKDKIRKREASKKGKLEEKQKIWRREEMKREQGVKQRRKRKFAMEGVQEARMAKRGRSDGGGGGSGGGD